MCAMSSQCISHAPGTHTGRFKKQFLPSGAGLRSVDLEAPRSSEWPGGLRLSVPPGKTSWVGFGECGQWPADLQELLQL